MIAAFFLSIRCLPSAMPACACPLINLVGWVCTVLRDCMHPWRVWPSSSRIRSSRRRKENNTNRLQGVKSVSRSVCLSVRGSTNLSFLCHLCRHRVMCAICYVWNGQMKILGFSCKYYRQDRVGFNYLFLRFQHSWNNGLNRLNQKDIQMRFRFHSSPILILCDILVMTRVTSYTFLPPLM